MHLKVRGRPDYEALVDAGITKAIAYSLIYYQEYGWWRLKPRNCKDIIRYRHPPPEACPVCGHKRVLYLFSLSGKYLEDKSDYLWMCRKCQDLRDHPPGEYVKAGDKLKPWSELTHQSKMRRIRRSLPKPATCVYCDNPRTELVSKSEAWPEDPADYAWMCRHHATMFVVFRRLKPPSIVLDPALFPWIQYTAAGAVQGPSILDARCALGRFYHVRRKFFGKVLR